MSFRIQFKLMSVVQSASSTYPFAISLFESVRVYDSTNEIVFARKGVDRLVSGYRKYLHDLFADVKLFNIIITNYLYYFLGKYCLG